MRIIWEKIPFKNAVYLTLGINLLILVFILFANRNLPPEIPLFYGNAVGEAQLALTGWFFVAPGTSLLVLILNTILSSIIKDSFLKKMLILSALFVSILVAITVFKIVFLVGLH